MSVAYGFFIVMDIGIHSRVKFYPNYIYHFAPRKNPDRLMLDYLYNWGEFSAQAEINFQRHLQELLRNRGRING